MGLLLCARGLPRLGPVLGVQMGLLACDLTRSRRHQLDLHLGGRRLQLHHLGGVLVRERLRLRVRPLCPLLHHRQPPLALGQHLRHLLLEPLPLLSEQPPQLALRRLPLALPGRRAVLAKPLDGLSRLAQPLSHLLRPPLRLPSLRDRLTRRHLQLLCLLHLLPRQHQRRLLVPQRDANETKLLLELAHLLGERAHLRLRQHPGLSLSLQLQLGRQALLEPPLLPNSALPQVAPVQKGVGQTRLHQLLADALHGARLVALLLERAPLAIPRRPATHQPGVLDATRERLSQRPHTLLLLRLHLCREDHLALLLLHLQGAQPLEQGHLLLLGPRHPPHPRLLLLLQRRLQARHLCLHLVRLVRLLGDLPRVQVFPQHEPEVEGALDGG